MRVDDKIIFSFFTFFFLIGSAAHASFSFAHYSEPGPFEVKIDRATGPGKRFTLYYPVKTTKPSPVLTWGNGTGMKPPRYDEFLTHLASHGNIVVASLSSNTGSGKEMLEGVTWILKENKNPNSLFFEKVDSEAVGALGHSQGGGGTIRAGADPRVKATAPLHPLGAPVEELKGPAFFVTGSNDVIVPPGTVKRQFEKTKVPAIIGNRLGDGHMASTGDAGISRGYVTAWFKWHLDGDAEASHAFLGENCGLCEDGAWEVGQHLME